MGYKDPKDVKTKLFHMSFSENELEEIEKYVKESPITTKTAFIREAISEKIMREENPELFMTKTVNNGKIGDFLEEIRGLTETQKQIVDQLADFNELKSSLSTLQRFVNKTESHNNEKIIVDLLKTHKHLTPIKIVEKTELSEEEVIECISNDSLFAYNLNGEVELK